VLMEAATWNGPNIKRTSTRLGLRSEASGRFEKQLQPEQGMEAQAVSTALMVELCGARLVPGTIDVGGPGRPPAQLHLREARVARLLGAEIPAARCAEILDSLGFEAGLAGDTHAGTGGVDALVPHWRRSDITQEIDLVEEVARIDGVDRLPQTLPSRPDGGGRLTPTQRARRRVEDALAGAGLLEVLGWSFQAPGVSDRLRLAPDDRRRRTVPVRNPLSEDQSELRALLLPSLLDAAAYNAARDAEDLALFETGSVYVADGDGTLPDERRHMGALLTGTVQPATWRSSAGPAADVFGAKGVLAAVLDALRLEWSVEPATEPFLHPGRAAAVHAGGGAVGWLGEVHPLVIRAWDLPDAVAGFELDLDRVAELAAGRVELFEDVTSFPAVRQDLAIVLSDDVPAARALDVVREAGGELLAGARVFDAYRGEQVGEGQVSVAVALEFRAPDRTLTDEEVNERRAAIAAALASELGAELRG
jgi:phenylalanyl-tRNA synthetase beta chain